MIRFAIKSNQIESNLASHRKSNRIEIDRINFNLFVVVVVGPFDSTAAPVDAGRLL